MPAVIFMLVNSEMANLTDKEPIPVPMVMFMWVNAGATLKYGKDDFFNDRRVLLRISTKCKGL